MSTKPFKRSRTLELQYLTAIDLDDKPFDLELTFRSGETRMFAKAEYFCGYWSERNWLNIPGPFYGALTDSCCAGIHEAPFNVLIDNDGREFIYRQPRNWFEFMETCNAAYVDPFAGYGCNGNTRWTVGLIREWWKQKDKLIETAKEIRNGIVAQEIEYYKNPHKVREWKPNPQWTNQANKDWQQKYHTIEGRLKLAKDWQLAIDEWEAYLQNGMEEYLKIYAFYLENRQLPKTTDILPDLHY